MKKDDIKLISINLYSDQSYILFKGEKELITLEIDLENNKQMLSLLDKHLRLALTNSGYNDIKLIEYYQPEVTQTTSKFYNSQEVADYFRVSTRTIQNWRDENLINFYQIGSVILYTQKDIDDFLDKHANHL